MRVCVQVAAGAASSSRCSPASSSRCSPCRGIEHSPLCVQVHAREQEQLEHEEGYLQMGDAALRLMKE